MEGRAWQGVVHMPVAGRLDKPRALGWTMVIDKGLSLTETENLLSVAADYIDVIKLAFGTSALYRRSLLEDKIRLIQGFGVGVMPGGTLGEIALCQGSWPAYLDQTARFGFDFLEISDGTIPLDGENRRAAIMTAREKGFSVISEVGKKHPEDQQPLEKEMHQALLDLACEARMVIIEGRESGKGIGIYDAQGGICDAGLNRLADGLPMEKVIWEAPLKPQQETMILRYGPNVNLGNIPPGDVLALEALRLGLRGDTLRMAMKSS